MADTSIESARLSPGETRLALLQEPAVYTATNRLLVLDTETGEPLLDLDSAILGEAQVSSVPGAARTFLDPVWVHAGWLLFHVGEPGSQGGGPGSVAPTSCSASLLMRRGSGF